MKKLITIILALSMIPAILPASVSAQDEPVIPSSGDVSVIGDAEDENTPEIGDAEDKYTPEGGDTEDENTPDGGIKCLTENAGDASVDGKVNAKDISVIMKSIAGHSVTLDTDLADVNRDEKVNAKDVSVLVRALAGYKNVRPGHADVLTATVEATCTEAGEGRLECTICGSSETVTIPAKGHHEELVVIEEAVCMRPGKGEIRCTVCGEVFGTKNLPAKVHRFKNHVCTLCGKVDPDYKITDCFNEFIKKNGTLEDGEYGVAYTVDDGEGGHVFYMSYDPEKPRSTHAGIVMADEEYVYVFDLNFVIDTGINKTVPHSLFEGEITSLSGELPDYGIKARGINKEGYQIGAVDLDTENGKIVKASCYRGTYVINDTDPEISADLNALGYGAIIEILLDIDAIVLATSPFTLESLGYDIPVVR